MGLRGRGGGGGGWWRWWGWYSMTWVVGGGSSGSRRWKFRWHPQAAHFSEVGSAEVAVGEGMNSPHPSNAWPPKLAAWFLRHSLYATTTWGAAKWWWWWWCCWCRFNTPFVKDNPFLGWICVGVSVSASGLLTPPPTAAPAPVSATTAAAAALTSMLQYSKPLIRVSPPIQNQNSTTHKPKTLKKKRKRKRK